MIKEEEKRMVIQWAEENGCTVFNNRYIRAYKAVHKVRTENGPRYISDWAVTLRELCDTCYVIPKDNDEETIRKIMEYKIGEYVFPDKFDRDYKYSCSNGIHVAGPQAAFNYGNGWADGCIIELEIDLDDKDLEVVYPLSVERAARGMRTGYSFKYFFNSEKFRVNKARVVGEIGCIYSRSFQRFINDSGRLVYDFEDSEKAWGIILDILDGVLVFTSSGNGRMHAASFKYLEFLNHKEDIADAAANFYVANIHPWSVPDSLRKAIQNEINNKHKQFLKGE